MSAQDLISELKHIRGGGFDYTETLLPRIIRLLEAGEKLAEAARTLNSVGDLEEDYQYDKSLILALSAYEEAEK